MAADHSQTQDRLDISDLLYRYAHAIDGKDFDILDSLFTADAVVHYDVEGGAELPFGEMKSWLGNVLQMFRATQHCVTNPVIVFDGPDSAHSVCYLTATHEQVTDDGRRAIFVDQGIYSDSLDRTADGWRIRHRKLTRIVCHGDFIAPDEAIAHPHAPESVVGVLQTVR